ncbi:MAG TPA: NUDIX hydrolase [Cytophagaceae bacterium]|jgi:8-oxo-dGTP diphosphatase|nr:NUDIX hydrolase [Cytophagaceae bacterium]
MRIRPAIVLEENSNIMLMRYSYSGKDVYQFPGGNTEGIESLEQTLIRELQEELNLPVAVHKLLCTAEVINSQKQQATLHCLFSGAIQNSFSPVINKMETSALEVVWMKLSKLDQLNLYPAVGIYIKELFSKKRDDFCHLGVIEQPWF